MEEQNSSLKEKNLKLLEMLKKSHEDRHIEFESERKKMEIENKKLALKEEREETLALISEHKFEVVITSYEGVNICINKLKKIKWPVITTAT